ncbi:TonB-dependent receptor domain-containing protein [Phenylobacterium deserti]|uniref:TonB-dependent receptor n=1 Tax=Phenylobacterium deserti TaxID=1914756 RepID=A0A328ADC4_9CAUL|nr:TonB-dependent receptor [Phenylobacterium deserti]RAK52669.1 TonB-dependent receptor [Phenylobacterium deserti]
MTSFFSCGGLLRRSLLACCAGAALMTAHAAAAQGAERPGPIAIDSQPLGSALTALARQADVQVLFAPSLVRGRQAGRVSGNFEPREALRQLLVGTGLRATPTGERTYTITAETAAAPSVMEELVVTAQKRAAAIEDVPVAVAVVDGEDATRRNITSVTDLVDEVAGLSVNYAFGGTNYGLISIRGIGGADDYKPNGNPSVALHVDGVYQTSNAYLGMPLFDLERIEILKGPQGTLYGRNTTAGVINAITRGPGDQVEGRARAEYGSYDYVAFEAAVGGPVTDRVGLRLAVLAEAGGGFMDGAGAGLLAGFRPSVRGVVQTQVPPLVNPGRREGFGDKNLVAGRGTLSVAFAPETELTLKLFGSRDRGDTRQYDRIARSLDATLANAGENADPYEFYSVAYPSHEIDIYGGSAMLEHRVRENLNFTAVGGWQGSQRAVQGNGDGSPYPASQFDADETLSQASLELRLSDETGGRLDWLVGGFFVRDEVDFDTNWISYSALTIYDNLHQQERDSLAAFGQADYRLTSRLQLSAGLRYTRDTASYRGRNVDRNPWGISTFTTTFATTNPFVWDEDFEDDNVSGRLTLKYDVTSDLNVFVSAGTGYRGGGFDGTSIFTVAETQPFASETVDAYEAGLRWTTSRLRVSLDAFRYRFKELQATTRLSNDTNGRANVGRARSDGAEITIGAELFRTGRQSFYLDASATFLDTEVLSFSSNRVAEVLQTVGDPLPGAPDVSATLALNHHLELAGDWRLDSRLGVTHHGEESNRLNASPGNTAPAYTLVNARVELTAPGDWSLYAYGRNITDEVYFPELNGAARLVGAPATYGVGARFAF